jgi:hypothetical protein
MMNITKEKISDFGILPYTTNEYESRSSYLSFERDSFETDGWHFGSQLMMILGVDDDCR